MASESTCPYCHLPLPKNHFGHGPRVYCSRRCSALGRMAQQRDVDDVVVDRLRLGYKTTSTKAERIEAVRVLTERGRSASWIAMLLRTTPRSITRYRAISRLSLN